MFIDDNHQLWTLGSEAKAIELFVIQTLWTLKKFERIYGRSLTWWEAFINFVMGVPKLGEGRLLIWWWAFINTVMGGLFIWRWAWTNLVIGVHWLGLYIFYLGLFLNGKYFVDYHLKKVCQIPVCQVPVLESNVYYCHSTATIWVLPIFCHQQQQQQQRCTPYNNIDSSFASGTFAHITA